METVGRALGTVGFRVLGLRVVGFRALRFEGSGHAVASWSR